MGTVNSFDLADGGILSQFLMGSKQQHDSCMIQKDYASDKLVPCCNSEWLKKGSRDSTVLDVYKYLQQEETVLNLQDKDIYKPLSNWQCFFS